MIGSDVEATAAQCVSTAVGAIGVASDSAGKASATVVVEQAPQKFPS